MSGRWIVVDDTDPQFSYNGPWQLTSGSKYDAQGNWGKTFNNSLHGLGSSGSLSFTFKGSRGRLLGTTDIKNTSGLIDPTWECFIDQKSFGTSKPFQYIENNWALCEWTGLDDGQHTASVRVASQGQYFWVDRLLYMPSDDVTLDNAATVLLDETDPAISVSSGWGDLGELGRMTQKQGSTAQVKFKGTSVTWMGTIPSSLPHASSEGTYSIDGGTPVRYTIPGLPDSDSADQFNYVFFKTDPVPLGDHELVVTHEGTESSTPLVLGNLLVENQVVQSNSAHLIGAIVGAVLGGLALILIAIVGVVYFRRYRKSSKSSIYKPINLVDSEPFHYIRPFTLTRPTDPYDPHPQPQSYSYPQQQPPPPIHYQVPITYAAPTILSSTSSSSGHHVVTPYPFTAPSATASSYKPPQPIHGHAIPIIRPPPPPGPSIPTQRRQKKLDALHNQATSPQSSAQGNSSTSSQPSSSSRVVIHQDSGVRLPGSVPEELATPVVEHPPRYTLG
ncbi:hypothetical protein DFP72DRAFT_842664 [Ephemerocybe angulata]|uniref:Transmembrane protein n=1 Tax=Ephemerocybe angulata TaxID=980116 RepID=A0A8H6IA96_9AGAR|nr:hypothetical protein DFP72DRAFT_842664 [Tulosesus angulatus]